jgi:hypothetical protein
MKKNKRNSDHSLLQKGRRAFPVFHGQEHHA